MENIEPSIWGGDAWRFLHALAKAYPASPDSETRREMFRFLSALQVLLPCAQCRQHFRQYMDKTQVRSGESRPLLSGAALGKWLDKAHLHANSHRDRRVNGEVAPAAAAGVASSASDPPVMPVAAPAASSASSAATPAPARPADPPIVQMAAVGAAVAASPVVSGDALAELDRNRRDALLACFGVVAIVLLCIFIAFVVVTFRQRGVVSQRVVAVEC
jgi:hypothetical protein